MTEVPRKPTFPDHIIKKIIARIERDVDEDVIPVSTGIYTEEKLIQKLSAIPKPVLQDYDDRIFYELVEKATICNVDNCSSCGIQFSNKIRSIMCHFCSKWRCEECTSHRQRLHPLDSNPNGPRYSICCDCDHKFLLLQLNHPYVENKILVEEAIMAVNKELQEIEEKVEALQERNKSLLNQPRRKLGIKQSIIKKQQLQLNKKLKKAEEAIENERNKTTQLLKRKKQSEQKVQQFKNLAIKMQIEKQEQQKKQIQERKKREEEEKTERLRKKSRIESSSSSSSSDQDKQQEIDDQKIKQEKDHKTKQFSSGQENYWRENTSEELGEVKFEAQKVQEQIKLEENQQSQLPSTYGEGLTEQDSKQNMDQQSQQTQQMKKQAPKSSVPLHMIDYFQQPELPAENYRFNQNRLSLEDEQKFSKFKKSMEEPEQDADEIQNAKRQLLKEAIMRQKQWENDDENVTYVDKGGKCKCSLF